MNDTINTINTLSGTVSVKTLIATIVILFLLCWGGFTKILPKIKSAYEAKHQKQSAEEKETETLTNMKIRLKDGDDHFKMLDAHMENFQKTQEEMQGTLSKVSGIVELLLKTQLKTIEAIQEMGANGKSKEAHNDIVEFMTKNALH